MGKASRNRAQRAEKGRRQRSRRHQIVVNAMEIGQSSGMLTLRMGEPKKQPPLCVVFPAPVAEEFLLGLGPASRDAEENYWKAMVPVVRSAGTSDPHIVMATVRKWLLAQDWQKALETTPTDETDLFLITHAGHVGLCVSPPFTHEPVVAIIDPAQIKRMWPQMVEGVRAARQLFTAPGPNRAQRLAAEVRAQYLLPWPQTPPGYRDPEPEEVLQSTEDSYLEFLRREPFVRPHPTNLRA